MQYSTSQELCNRGQCLDSFPTQGLSEPSNALSVSATFPWQQRMPAINTAGQEHDNISRIKYTNVFYGSQQPAIHNWSWVSITFAWRLFQGSLLSSENACQTICLPFHFCSLLITLRIVWNSLVHIYARKYCIQETNHVVNATVNNEPFYGMVPDAIKTIFICPFWFVLCTRRSKKF